MNYYISDLHFGHKNVIRFDGRPFADVDEMDVTLIGLWNKKVSDDDHIYIIGDLCFRNGREEQWYVQQLKGHKHLILGNHDIKIQTNKEAMSYFESVEQIKIIKDGNKDIVLCHFPLASWPMEKHGAWHIFGHVHGNRNAGDRADAVSYMHSKDHALNAGCMINDFSLVTFEELVQNNKRFWKDDYHV